MKLRLNCLLFVLLLLSTKPLLATTYYLSNSGNDSFSGTRADSAWQTITKLNTTTIQPGDSVLFETGGVFRGQINLLNSGAAGQSIYFGSYNSTGANPIISGGKLITGWTIYSGNVYIADVAETVTNVFVNKAMMTSARYPNSGFLTIDSSGVNTGLYDPRLNISPNWPGAHLKVRSSDTKYEEAVISSFNSGWIGLSAPTTNTLNAGYGYYIDHSFPLLDTANEWFYDTSIHKLFLYAPNGADPNTLTVEGTVFDYGISATANNSFIKVKGIDFENQGKDGVLFNGNNQNVSFLNCNFRNCYLRAINLNVASNDTIDHCLFSHIYGDGISFQSSLQSIVSNNIFSKIGTLPGYGLDGVTEYDAIRLNGNGNNITTNLLDTIGFIGLVFTGKNNLFEKNSINHALLLMNNNAAIFTYSSDSSQTIIKDNFIFNTIGNNTNTPNPLSANGILLSSSSSLSLLHNTIANTTTHGIYFQSNNYNNTVQNNVIYNSGNSQIYLLEADTLSTTHDNGINGNIFYCLNDNQRPMTLDGNNPQFKPGIFDSNYYCNPYDYFSIYRRYFDGKEFYTITYSLPEWRGLFTDNTLSKSSLVQWNSYKLSDTTGNQLIENGDFTNNFDGWTSQPIPITNNEILLDNDIGFDGGCAKFRMLSDTPFIWGLFQSPTFNCVANQLYQISFSGKALKKVNAFVHTKEAIFPFDNLNFNNFFPLDTGRSDFNRIFKASSNFSSANLTFEIRYQDSLIWLDNVHLYPVNATHNDSSKLSRLITNYSANTVNIALGDSVYRDLDGKLIQGNYTLQPYSSYVLTLDSPLFLIAPAVSKPENSLTLFPNPLNPSGQQLHYHLDINDGEKANLQIIDLLGNAVLSTQLRNSSGVIQIPNSISSGLYLVRTSNSIKTQEKKLVILR